LTSLTPRPYEPQAGNTDVCEAGDRFCRVASAAAPLLAFKASGNGAGLESWRE
jgi:hypothetical protein